MDTAPKVNRETATSLTIDAASIFIEMLTEFRKLGGWAKWPEKIIQIRKNIKIDNYHALYDDERAIGTALCLAILGKEGFKTWSEELNSLPQSEQQDAIEEIIKEAGELDFQGFFHPQTEEDCNAAKDIFDKLSDEDKQEATRRAQFFMLTCFLFYTTLLLSLFTAKNSPL